jgi:hypothetical protein
MKNKFAILLWVIVFLLVGFLWLFHNREKLKPVVSTQFTNTNSPVAENVAQPSIDAPPTDTNANTATLPEQVAKSADTVALDKKVQAEIEAKNVPLDFYGRVIDQDSNSLSGAKFELAVRHWSTNTLGAIHIERETDADGRFDIHGETGDAFDIEAVGKEGYELEPGQRSYGAVGGSFENPVIFKMWSTHIHEQLITEEKKFQIVPDGRPYVIDLIKGTIAESGDGDLKVWVKRPAQITSGVKYGWSSEVDVINGGLLQETDLNSSMYSAPADGYAQSFQFEQKVASGWGDSTGSKRFYVRLKNGQMYGRITIELFAYYNDHVPGMVRVQYALNPSGSQVLH